MIAAVGSVFLLPWNWCGNPTAILFSLGILAALIGPLFGVLIAGYYVGARQRIKVDAMSTMDPAGPYWYRKGFNPNAVAALLIAGVPNIVIAIVPTVIASMGGFDIAWISDYTWFIGCGLAYLALVLLERRHPTIPVFADESAGISDGTLDGAASTAASEPPAISVAIPVQEPTARESGAK